MYLILLIQELELLGLLSFAQTLAARIAEPGNEADEIRARRLAIATANEERFRDTPVQLIAVGQNCLPDELTQRWGLGALRIDGPFRALAAPRNGAATAIEDDFKQFAVAEAYRVDKSQSGIQLPILLRYGLVLNHETGEDWIDEDLLRLRALYAERIKNFWSAMANDYLVFINVRGYDMDTARLWRAISQRTDGAAKRMLIINLMPRKEADKDLPEGVRMISPAVPYPVMQWFLPMHYNTAAGFAFEKAVVDAIIEEIEAIRG